MASPHSPAPDTPVSNISAMTRPMLSVVGEKFLPARCRPRTLSYCPTMDLIAVVTVLDRARGDQPERADERLSVWRLNGQQVFGWDAPAGLGIPFVRWKTDGRLIALGTSDGVIRLLNVMNGGRMVHCLAAVPGKATTRSGLSWLAWAINFGDVKGMKGLLGQGEGNLTLDDILSLDGGRDMMAKLKPNLPRELACGIDVEASIPKLSPLPPGTGVGGSGTFGGDDDVFSTRASIDSIFHSHVGTAGRSSRHDEVDVLLTGFEDGTVYIRIFDCFDIGEVDISSSLPKDSKSCRVVQHVAHPLSSIHALFVQTRSRKNDEQLHVIALDLNFIRQTSPYYLSTLATKSTQLLNLLRYLSQISTLLSIEFRSAFDLPGRFIRNINDTLAQITDGPMDFVTAAYQLVVTGECSDELRDWMIDEIGERNLKRWEKASMAGMENIRKFVHECLLPALERCQVVLSRLEGLSRFAKSAQVLGLDTQSLHQVMDTVKCLNLLGHYLLKTVGKEIKQFNIFIKWLRLEVDIQGSERENAGGIGSERLDEMCMRRDEVDVRTVLEYIQGVMRKSGMVAFLRPSVDARGSSLDGNSYDWAQHQVPVDFYETFKRMLKTPVEPGQRPDLDDLLRRLKGQAEKVFDTIAQSLRKSIMHSRVCNLQPDCDVNILPARITTGAQGGHEVIFATYQGAHSQISIHHIPWKTSQQKDSSLFGKFAVPGKEEVVDMKFVEDSELMVLTSGRKVAHLNTFKYSFPKPEWQDRHNFDLSDGRKPPSELEVNGRKGRRAACVVEDGIRFTVLDIDSAEPDQEISGQDEDVVMQ